MNFSVMLSGLIMAAPYLVAWIVAIIVAVIMLRRGGHRAERFLLAGSCLMLTTSLLSVPIPAIVSWLVEGGASRVEAASVISGFNLFRGFIGLAGILCLIYAFWIKFKVKSNASS
jgi:hypothetical protein